ncbi:MAG: hypothetical protein M3Y18_06110 [Candidatus Eremiobacteraeota bacterium]|nr:hypothetical protein [Candidatus Eremiobacteraeota bacterium]
MEDPNNPAYQNPGKPYNIDPSCPLYPYAAGTPVQIYGGNTGNICSQDIESFYGDRSSHMYLGALDYTNVVGPKLTFNFGLGQEYDNNLLAYDLKDSISGNGTFPNVYAYSDIPTHLPYVYTNLTAKVGKFSLTPGLRYQREYYGIPASAGGSRFVSALIPSFNGTYQAGPNDVFRFSYGVSEDFIGSAYVYRSYPHAAGGAVPNSSYNPSTNGASFNPEQNHSADLMWEHQFGPDTSLRFGPFLNSANNYYEQYNFLKGYTATGNPIYSKQTYFTNAGTHHAFGLELAVNHVDHHPTGVSWWLSATLDNYWTSSPGAVTAVSPLVRPFPTYFAANGIQFRSSDNPLFAANFYADIHSGRFDLYPKFYYQVGTFYNIGTFQPKVGPPQIIPEAKALGYFTGQVSETYKLDPAGSTIIGVAVRNLFDMEHGTTPCFNSGSGTGCYPFDGPQSGFRATPRSYVYQNVTTDPRRFEFFITKKLP